jgi:voltage-gated potassium channel
MSQSTVTSAAPVSMGFYSRIQRSVFETLEGEVHNPVSKAVEIFIAVLVLLNVLSIILESLHDLHAEYEHWFYIFDSFSVVVFTIEYLLRVWSGGAKYEIGVKGNAWRGRKDYMFSPFGIVDFASTVPFYLQLILPGADLRMLRMFRLLRIFKLSRYNTAMEDMFQAIKAEKDSFSSALFLLLISCLLFSSLIYIVEGHDEHAVFSSIPAAMHWFMITIISGWGNVDPETYMGIYLVVITQVLAIALAAILTGVVATAYTTQVQRRESFYEQQLREVLKDGVVTEEEKAHLKKMQADFGMSDEQVAAIADQIEEEKAQAAQKSQATQPPAMPQAPVVVEAPVVKERVTANDLSSLDPDEKLNLLASLVDSLSLRQKSSLLNRVADSLAHHSIVVETVPPKSSGPDPVR